MYYEQRSAYLSNADRHTVAGDALRASVIVHVDTDGTTYVMASGK